MNTQKNYAEVLEALRKDRRIHAEGTSEKTTRNLACDAMAGIIRTKKNARFLVIIREPDDRVRWKDHMKSRLGHDAAMPIIKATTFSCAGRMNRLTTTAWDMTVIEDAAALTRGNNENNVRKMTSARILVTTNKNDSAADVRELLASTFGEFIHINNIEDDR